MQIDEENLEAYALGCGLLGGGGGGETRTAVLMAREAIREHGPIEVAGLGDLADDDFLMPCGLLGAPTVSLEKVPARDEGDRLVAAVQELTGRAVAALMCVEIGGSNGLFPLIWAVRRGLPVVDADGAGRAFPQLLQMSMHVTGVPVAPVVLTDERHNVVTLGGEITTHWAERLCRSTAVAFGGRACAAMFTMDAKQARRAAVTGSVSHALSLGELLVRHRTDPFGALSEKPGVVVLARGKIADVVRVTQGGFARGSAIVHGTGDDRGRMIRVEFQNENLVAIEDGQVVATTPTVICLLDDTTAEAVATEELQFGQRVAVVLLPCDDVWHSPEGLEVAGPRAFGYDIDVTRPAGVR
ncbi:DUF917 domain-containing protein [Sinosporangium siamense]|uniref:DUF917 domain-containing protein n=1 Tax=Sinosporangium siamense TaxID=1367973 RepID=A0A919RNP1_9ACTN|nr:DUF917 domain-containing protein [Sinosporangium siamense]GII95334.1 hypothetical protein Ssi02_55650 [Sinosporangium siamense]